MEEDNILWCLIIICWRRCVCLQVQRSSKAQEFAPLNCCSLLKAPVMKVSRRNVVFCSTAVITHLIAWVWHGKMQAQKQRWAHIHRNPFKSFCAKQAVLWLTSSADDTQSWVIHIAGGWWWSWEIIGLNGAYGKQHFFQKDYANTTFCTQYKGMTDEEEGPDLPIQKTCGVNAMLHICLQEEWDKTTPETLHLVSSVLELLLSDANGDITKW